MKTRHLYVAAITVATYVLASCYGYSYYLANPKGILLYTPPAHGDIIYTPAFSVGFSLVLLISCIIAMVIALFALLARNFLASEKLRLYTLSIFIGCLLIVLLCLPGIFCAEAIWYTFNP